MEKSKSTALQFDNIVDLWSKEKIKKMMKEAKIGYLKGQRFFKKTRDYGWGEQYEKVKSSYYSHKAIFHGANQNLPYSTLVLIGKCLSNTSYKEATKQVLEENVIKFDGEFLKLDTPENQKRVRKALRTYQFNQELVKVQDDLHEVA